MLGILPSVYFLVARSSYISKPLDCGGGPALVVTQSMEQIAEDDEWERRHDILAGRDPNPLTKVPWAAKVDIQLGILQKHTEMNDRQLEALMVRIDKCK